MEQNQTAGQQITLETALALTGNFRAKYPEAVQGYLISAENIKMILAQEGCTGIRIYNGYDEETGQITPVIVGTNSGNDMCSGVILDKALPCPNYCDSSSALCR
ncbi:hypothetical protein HYN48_10325 [Flavobacterium magnum]|uniref:Uncharacterized protein n=1 Tax=Flavobacterium magnum TaxID=2162713 RepID=A0A2S0RFY9_9FLAO|nr:hypothetical protein [Flavobacterium magnum]AWA30449.1 hypothetical protein HYN48_10325 [Flavobacterium magnum]